MAKSAQGSRSFIQAAYMKMTPKAMRRINAAIPVLLFEKVIQGSLDPVVIEYTLPKKRISFRFVSYQHGRCAGHRERVTFRKIVLDGALHARVFDQRYYFLMLRGRE